MKFNPRVHDTYENTSINAIEVGWAIIPEYCFGDPNAKFVTHNHTSGKFYFHNGWKVIDGNDQAVLGNFPFEEDASIFIDSFDDAESGRYTIDGPLSEDEEDD